MPYTMEKVPDRIKELPKKAQEIWIAAFNAAYKEYDKDEEKSNATAWAAVKNKYEQDKDGKWIMKERAKADVSIDEMRETICKAFYDFTKGSIQQKFVVEIYPAYIIFQEEDKYYKVGYSINQGEVTFSDNTMEVQRSWVETRSKQDVGKELDDTIEINMRLGQAQNLEGTQWEVTICQAGLTKNGWNIPDEVLRMKETAEYFDGADINYYALPDGYATHLPDNLFSVKDLLVKNKCGFLGNVRHVAGEGLKGVITFLDSAKQFGKNMLSAMQKGHSTYGLSYDMPVRAKQEMINGRNVMNLIKFAGKGSVDLVTRPAAGGRFERALAALPAQQNKGDTLMNKQQMLDTIKELRPELLQGKDFEKITEDETVQLMRMAMAQDKPTTQTSSTAQTQYNRPVSTTTVTLPQGDFVSKTELDKLRCEMALSSTLEKSDLPQVAKDRIKATYESKIFEKGEVERAIAAEKDYLEKIIQPANKNIPPANIPFHAFSASNISVGLDTQSKMSMAMDKLFGIKQDDVKSLATHTTLNGEPFFEDHNKRSKMDCENYNDVVPFKSIREAYYMMTGDNEVSGRFNPEFFRGKMDITSGTFTYVLGNTLARRIVQTYRSVDFKEQMIISTKKTVKDYRLQEAVLVGYFGNVADVDTESKDYAEITPVTDERSPYTLSDHGNVLSVSIKTIINDDVSLIQKLIERFGRATRRTHAAYVWSLITANTNCTDATAYFTSGHGNYTTSALTHSTGLTAYLALASMTEKDSGEPLGILDDGNVKVNLFSNTALMATGQKIATEDFYYSSNDLTYKLPNPLVNKVNYNMTSLITDANDWFMFLPPDLIDICEIGYLNGRTEPELFILDNPNSQQMFFSEKISYKYRHSYKGTLVDYRGGYMGEVA